VTTRVKPENIGAYLSGTSKTRHGIQALSQNTLGRHPQPARSTIPTTEYEGWTPPRPSTFGYIKTGIQGDEDAELDLDEEGGIKVPSSVNGPSYQRERRP
jgi:hypothetical protein